MGFSTFNSHRAAFFNLFRDYKKIMSQTLATELSTCFKGLKRKIISDVAAGQEGDIKIGKDPISFGLYRYLALSILQTSSRESIFALCFMTICWNLMSRSSNAFKIFYDHIEWSEDSLLIYFIQMKNDQFGDRPRDPRHIYANPLMPEINPILILGLYWLTYPFDKNNTQLFPGNNQYERFQKILGRVLEMESIAEELEHRGIQKEDIGAHSLRKGAASFCASGSTACPSSTSVHLRAVWSSIGVQDTYLRYESAGDMFVGRTVSGLPIDQAEFSILPPFFSENSDFVKDIITQCFPNMPSKLFNVCKFCLASVIYHESFLRETLPKNHPVLHHLLFRDRALLEKCKALVVCTLPYETESIKATGIPPHVSILTHMKNMMDKIQESTDKQEGNMKKIIDGIILELEKRAIGAGTVTRDGLKESLMSCLEEAGVMKVVKQLNTPTINEELGDEVPQQYQVYSWGGGLHLFPEDFEFPGGSVLNIWEQWCCGNPNMGYPPLRKLTPKSLSSINKKKRLCDLKFLMNRIEERAKALGIYHRHPTVKEAIEIFDKCSDCIALPEESVKKRKRRYSQLAWITVSTLLRQMK